MTNVRRPLGGAAVLAVVAAGTAAIVLLWVPAVRAQHDRAWQKAGERATTALRLPARFQPFHTLRDGSSSVSCTPRCFVTTGQPRDNVGAVAAALRDVATGRVDVSCGPDGGFAVAPDKCRVVAPVRGSRLAVFVYARFRLPQGKQRPVRADDFNGTIVSVSILPRD